MIKLHQSLEHFREHRFILRQRLLYVGEGDLCINRESKNTVKDLIGFINNHLKEDFYSSYAFESDSAFRLVESGRVDNVVLVGKQNLVFPRESRFDKPELYFDFVDEVHKKGLGLAAVMVYGQKFPKLPSEIPDIEKIISYPKNRAPVIARELRDYFRSRAGEVRKVA
jgi:hypothetical protein